MSNAVYATKQIWDSRRHWLNARRRRNLRAFLDALALQYPRHFLNNEVYVKAAEREGLTEQDVHDALDDGAKLGLIRLWDAGDHIVFCIDSYDIDSAVAADRRRR